MVRAGPVLRRWWRCGYPAALAGALGACGLLNCRALAEPTTPAVAADATYQPPENPAELLQLDEPMRRYFAGRITSRWADSDRLREIIDAILQPTALNFAYDARATLDARETFRQRRGNCVSFSFLVVAVAREFGFQAAFQNVDAPPRWDRFGKLVASLQHLNVRVTGDDAVFIVDLRPDMIPVADSTTTTVLRDEAAFAEFYNNIGFFRLVEGQPEEAMRQITRATTIDPRCSGAWSNRANLHARAGEFAAARACFERSLAIDPRGLTALDGLIAVLKKLGSPDDQRQAAKLERRAQSLRDRNPLLPAVSRRAGATTRRLGCSGKIFAARSELERKRDRIL